MEEHADGDNDLGRFMDIDAVLSSTTQLKISNAGGEIFIGEGSSSRWEKVKVCIWLDSPHSANRYHSPDYCTRADRTEHWTNGFKDQMDGIVDSYLHWSADVGKHGLHADLHEPNVKHVQGFRHLEVLDVYRKCFQISHNIWSNDI